jgi:hypothetical protein
MMRGFAVVLALLAVVVPVGRAAGKPPSLAAACGDASGIRARSLWLTAADRVHLYAVEAGTGPRAVVLAHQGGSNLCEELPYAKTLLARGLRVLASIFAATVARMSPPRTRSHSAATWRLRSRVYTSGGQSMSF